MKLPAWASSAAAALWRATEPLRLHDRWTHALSVLLAAALHVPLLLLGGRQYLQAATKPQGANQAAQRVQPMMNQAGKPIRFVYVKDAVPSQDIPKPGAPLSDMTRRGASPDPRKGTSPDPTSMGGSPVRQSGGPGAAPASRPASQPSVASPQPVPSQPGATTPESGRGGPTQGRAEREVARAAQEIQGSGRGVQAKGQPAKAESGLPVGGEREGAPKTPPQENARPGSQAPPAKPGRPGLGTQLQELSAGALQGGFNNPNASRLNTGELSFDTAAWDLGPYARKVQERVQSNWRTPEAQMILRQKGWVAIRFNIQKDGRVTDLQVVRPSGIPSYDRSAMDALRSSNPLPPLPVEVTAPQLGALFRFFYNVEEEP